MNSEEVLDETGVTYRKLDYWVRSGIVPVKSGKPTPGSGYYREFDEKVINRIKLLDILSKTFSNRLSVQHLKQIYEAYEDGYIELNHNGYKIMLTWELCEEM